MSEQNYTEFLGDTLNEAAKIALSYFGNVTGNTKAEDSNQVLTDADVAVGEYIVERVQAAYPAYNVIDEEAGVIDKKSSLTWVIDPIDGTSNFAAGTPDWGIMIGLLEDNQPIAGGIIAPVYNHLYLAEKGGPATRNGQPIRVTHETDLLKTLVSFGIDSHREDPAITAKECAIMSNVILAVRNIRASGSEAIDPMYVADGRYGGRVNYSGKIWDVVAPQAIIEAAGGVFTDATGQPIDYSNALERTSQNFTSCMASPQLHAQLLQEIHRA